MKTAAASFIAGHTRGDRRTLRPSATADIASTPAWGSLERLDVAGRDATEFGAALPLDATATSGVRGPPMGA